MENFFEYYTSFTTPVDPALKHSEASIMSALVLLSCFVPKVGFFLPIYVLWVTNGRVSQQEQEQIPLTLEQTILFIQMNHLQSLTEAIEQNPELLYMDYKKKSLLYWCKHYKNTKAHTVILQLMKRYPSNIVQNLSA